MMITYEMHEAFLLKQVKLADAELIGFRQASMGGPLTISPVEEIQRRFDMGYRDGLAKIEQDTVYGVKEEV